jgi:hypothetical protein
MGRQRQEIEQLARKEPFIYKMMQLTRDPDISYEDALEEVVLRLVEANKTLTQRVTDLEMIKGPDYKKIFEEAEKNGSIHIEQRPKIRKRGSNR